MEVLSFPGLGLQFTVNRIAFTVAGRPIYWYGIILAAAFLAAAAYVLSRARTFGLDGDRVMDVILGSVLLGIIGARAYYVIFRWATYSRDPLSVFNIREGGVAIYGGIIGGVIAALIICKIRKVKLLPMLDLGAGGLLLGQAIGRWGNFVNMEAFGRNTTASWGMTSPSIIWYLKQNTGDLTRLGVVVDPSLPVHPTFFYESMWCLLGFLLVMLFTKRRRFDGEIWLMYLGWYGIGRFFIEGLRTDSLLFGTMRVSQILALLCVIASVLTLIIVLSKIKRENDPGYLKIYVDTDEGKAVLAGEFYKKKENPAKTETAEAVEIEADETAEAVDTEVEEAAEAVGIEADEAAETVETEADEPVEAEEIEAEESAEAAETVESETEADEN